MAGRYLFSLGAGARKKSQNQKPHLSSRSISLGRQVGYIQKLLFLSAGIPRRGGIESRDIPLLNAARRDGKNGIKGVVDPGVGASGVTVYQVCLVAERCVAVNIIVHRTGLNFNSILSI
jgi:hypothetical protein